jgi:hypothetical protein
MASAVARLPAAAPMADAAAAALADVEAREHSRIERDDLHRHWAYVVSDDAYFNLDDRSEVSRAAFNALYAGLSCRSRHGKRPVVTASKWFDEWRHERGGRALSAITYAAGLPALVERATATRWATDGLMPDRHASKARGRRRCGWRTWSRCCPKPPSARRSWTCWRSSSSTRTSRSITACCSAGHAGCGKDSLMAPFLRAVCGPHQRNRGLVQGDELNSQFGYHLECEVLVLNELRDSDRRRAARAGEQAEAVARRAARIPECEPKKSAPIRRAQSVAGDRLLQ